MFLKEFFSFWVFFHEHSRITGLQGKGEGISLTPHYHFHPFHRHLDISQTFFNYYFAVPRPTLGHSQGDSLTNPMLIITFVQVRPEGHREPRNFKVRCSVAFVVNFLHIRHNQLTFTCSTSTIETIEKGVKYVRS